jgi:hypothetical protein
MIDCITECLRLRLGSAIITLQQVQRYAPIIAVMDSGAVAWVQSQNFQVSRTQVDSISNGQSEPIAFNLQSSRHLVRVCVGLFCSSYISIIVKVIRMQSLLLSVPQDSKGSRDARWSARKEKCDALLTLCTALNPLQQSKP